MMTRWLRILVLVGVAVSSFLATTSRGDSFEINASVTNLSLHLKAATIPAGRLVWYQGSRPESITNILQIEALPAVQHDLSVGLASAAAFFRAMVFDTNAESFSLAAGEGHSLAITPDGSIEAWGDNWFGEYGNGTHGHSVTNFGAHVACWTVGASVTTADNGPGPEQQSSDTDWICVAAGYYNSLGIKADGSLWGWGDNTYGQLGLTNKGSSPLPVQIGVNQQWRSVFAFVRSSFAIRRDGTLWAWGENKSSGASVNLALGLGSPYTNVATVWTPTQVGASSNWVKVVSCGVGLQSDGSLWAWGNTPLPSSVRAAFSITNVTIPDTLSPAPVGVPGPWVDVTSHGQGLVALKADGSMWRDSGDDSVGRWGSYASFLQAQKQSPGSIYNILVGAGLSSDLALGYAMTNLFLPYNSWAVGYDFGPEHFAAFLQDNSDANLMQPCSARKGWTMVRGNNVLNRDGTIWVIGGSTYGGRKDFDMQHLNDDTDWKYVTAGAIAAKSDGSVWSWNGVATQSADKVNDMVAVATTNKWLRVKKTSSDVVALDTSSNLWAWGDNSWGQLGMGDNQTRLKPAQVPVAGPWLDFSATARFTLGIRQGGELWAWGDYNFTRTNVATPLRLNPERSWRSVFAHHKQAYALAKDGTLWLMGYAHNLGLGNTNRDLIVTNLTQLPGTNWSHVSPSDWFTLALKGDGSLWGWGGNNINGWTGYEFGLGYETNAVFAVPTAMPGPQWSNVTAQCSEFSDVMGCDADGGFGIQPDGTLWAWGAEDFWSQQGIPWLNSLYNREYWDCVHSNSSSTPPLVIMSGAANGAANGCCRVTLSPNQVGTDNDWKSVRSAGSEATGAFSGATTAKPDYSSTVYTLGLKTNGTLWVWGKSPFACVTNKEVYLTPPTHPYPNVPYPQVTMLIPIPQQVGTNLWAYADIEAAITTHGDLYMWGANTSGQLLQSPSWWPGRVQGNLSCRLPSSVP